MVIKKYNFKIIVLGLMTSITAFAFTFNYEVEKEKLHFITSANNIFNNIEYMLSTLERTNNELSTRFYLSDEMTKSDFKFFASSIIKQDNFIESILFSKNIPIQHKSKYELSLQNKGYTGFRIKPFTENTSHLSPTANFLLPVKYIEPFSVKNSRFFGLNLYTHATIYNIFNRSSPPKNLSYKTGGNIADGFHAVNFLYRGREKHLQRKGLSDLYGILLYTVKIKTISQHLHALSLKTNNKIIFKKETKTTTSLIDIISDLSKNITIGNKEITINVLQGKSLFSINLTYPIIVLLLGLLLTELIRKIINSHNKINLLLQKQKNTIEKEVKIKTNELKTKADELEAFSYSVSHDLKAPLHSIDGFSQLLQVSYSDTLDEDANNYIEHICSATKKMDSIINDLLELSQISRSDIKIKTSNISEIAERAIDTIQDYEPNKKVSLYIKKEIYADVDPNLLQICFDNLFSNAWKYSSKVDNPHIEFGTTEKNNETVYYVKDNGIGFNMYDSDKLFVPFQRLHHNSEFEGTGIGLMTVKRIIQKHNGHIWANSKPGEGATFYFTLKAKH